MSEEAAENQGGDSLMARMKVPQLLLSAGITFHGIRSARTIASAIRRSVASNTSDIPLEDCFNQSHDVALHAAITVQYGESSDLDHHFTVVWAVPAPSFVDESGSTEHVGHVKKTS